VFPEEIAIKPRKLRVSCSLLSLKEKKRQTPSDVPGIAVLASLHHAREMGEGGLTNTKAQWWQNPVSDKQPRILGYLHVPYTLPLTIREASDLISTA